MRAQKSKKKTTAGESDPTQITAATPSKETSVQATPNSKKKQKKVPQVVAVVTPEGIEGSFLPEPRRPLIVHLQVHSNEIQFHDAPIHYDPNPPGELEAYDADAADLFADQNAEIQIEKATVNQEVQPVKETNSDKPSVGLDAFTKMDLMVQFRSMKTSQVLPEKTDTACFWCAHPFDWKPCILPEREEKGIYRVYGNFCCPSCAMAYLLSESLDCHVRWERMALLHRIYAKAYSTARIFPSPGRESLKVFGGPMTIEQFRATVAAGKVRVDFQVPPMVSILGSIDTKPVDFYDSSLKNTISPLLGEALPKAEEGLRLKRTKPLRDKESTLDSCLKIQIKGRS
jgi:hypothetical protein